MEKYQNVKVYTLICAWNYLNSKKFESIKIVSRKSWNSYFIKHNVFERESWMPIEYQDGEIASSCKNSHLLNDDQ